MTQSGSESFFKNFIEMWKKLKKKQDPNLLKTVFTRNYLTLNYLNYLTIWNYLLICSYHYSLSSSPREIWTDWRKLLVDLSTFVKLDECGLIRPHRRNAMWQVFHPNWNFVWVWKHEIPCALDKIIMAEVSGYVVNIFHDVNSILYAVTNIYSKAGILLKCYQFVT